MTRARKLLQKCCERCTEWSSTDACEDHITCPVFQLYVLADGKWNDEVNAKILQALDESENNILEALEALEALECEDFEFKTNKD